MPRRPPVSPARIVQESAAIADEMGLDALTMAAVAKRLSITVPALYKHVPSLAAVRRDIALLGIDELRQQVTEATVGKAGPVAIQAAAAAYRRYAHTCPGRYAASVMAPPPGDAGYTAASDAAVEMLFAVLGAYQFERADAIDAVRIFRAMVHGFVSLEAAGGFGLPQSLDASFERLVATYISGLDRWHNAQDDDEG